MKKYKILSAQKRRLLSRVSTLEGTRDKAQNKIYELLQEIDDLQLEIEDELKQETQKPTKPNKVILSGKMVEINISKERKQ